MRCPGSPRTAGHRFHLLQHELERAGLLVWGVAVLDDQPPERRAELGAHVVANRPVGAHVAAHDRNQFMSDLREDVFALLGYGRLVLGDGVVERELVGVQRRTAEVKLEWSKEVIRMSSTPEQPVRWPADDFVSTEELVRRQGITPITSVDQLAQEDPFESHEEYQEFLADLYVSRRSCIS